MKAKALVKSLLPMALALVLAGCGGGSPAAEAPQGDDIEGLRTDMAAAARKSSPEVRRILADGVVTDAEEDEAVANLLRCAKKAGIDAKANYDEDGNQDGFSYRLPGGPGDIEISPNGDAFDACDRVHFQAVAMALALQRSLADGPSDALDERVQECLAEHGIDAPGWPTTDVEIDPAVEGRCYDGAKAADPG